MTEWIRIYFHWQPQLYGCTLVTDRVWSQMVGTRSALSTCCVLTTIGAKRISMESRENRQAVVAERVRANTSCWSEVIDAVPDVMFWRAAMLAT